MQLSLRRTGAVEKVTGYKLINQPTHRCYTVYTFHFVCVCVFGCVDVCVAICWMCVAICLVLRVLPGQMSACIWGKCVLRVSSIVQTRMGEDLCGGETGLRKNTKPQTSHALWIPWYRWRSRCGEYWAMIESFTWSFSSALNGPVFVLPSEAISNKQIVVVSWVQPIFRYTVSIPFAGASVYLSLLISMP